jgi:hypothetical protein
VGSLHEREPEVGFGSGLCGKEQAMDAREANGRRQLGGDDAITTKIGALALALAIPVLVVAEYFHPSKEDPMDNHAVFMEYAHSHIWTTVHLGEYFGFLLLLGGLVALYYSVSAKPGVGAGLAPFGLAAAVTAAASFIYGPPSRGRGGPKAGGGCLGECIGPSEDCRLRGSRGGSVDRDSDEQLLVLPCRSDPLPVRLGHRTRERLPALGGSDSSGFRSCVHVRRRGGGGLRGLRTIDHQVGGSAFVGCVGIHYGLLDVAQRWPSAHHPPRADSSRSGAAPRRHPLTVPVCGAGSRYSGPSSCLYSP